MSRAILIPFLRYTPHVGDYYKVFYDFFLKHYDPSVADKVYLIDGDHGFYDLPSNAVVLQPASDKSHWASVKKALDEIPERYVFLMDQDTLIWDWGKVKEWFRIAEETGKWVTGLDGSGHNLPGYEGLARLTPYYTIIDKEVYNRCPEKDFTPKNGHDSFGEYTRWVFYDGEYYLGGRGTFYEIHDDRATIHLELDTPVRKPEIGSNYGYYHVRNGNLANYLITTKQTDVISYSKCHSITPSREALRILAWFSYLSNGLYQDEIHSIAKDFGCHPISWDAYMDEFRRYHCV